MASSELLEQWRIIEESLRRASSLIVANSSSEDNTLAAFEEYMSHNELGLALEELAEAVTHSLQGRRFWDAMVQAAMSMKLDEWARMFMGQWVSTAGLKETDCIRPTAEVHSPLQIINHKRRDRIDKAVLGKH